MIHKLPRNTLPSRPVCPAVLVKKTDDLALNNAPLAGVAVAMGGSVMRRPPF